MYAGTPRVVASLWRVPDSATAALMQRFYQALLVDRRPPAESLRLAQESVRAERRWAAPYYWAGFTLAGEWK
jgi:CHAT domain-containing protein